MAEFGGRLFCGTLPSGKVWSIAAGKDVTYDRELKPGWRHVAAIRSGSRLILYIDGQEAAQSPRQLNAGTENVDTSAPLLIGFGVQTISTAPCGTCGFIVALWSPPTWRDLPRL